MIKINMRTFNDYEKKIIEEIKCSNGKRFSELFKNEIKDCKIILNKESDRVSFHYETKGFNPTEEELKRIEKISYDLNRKIVLTVQVVDILIKEGLISLYSREKHPDTIVLGNNEISDLGIIQDINDENIRRMFLKFCDQILIIYTDLSLFIKKGFRTNSEFREIWLYRLTWIGISIALITSIAGIFMNLNPNYEEILDKQTEIVSEIKNLNKNQLTEISLVESLLNSVNKIDSLNEQTGSNINDLKKNMLRELERIIQTSEEIEKACKEISKGQNRPLTWRQPQ